jgi:transposase
MIGIDSEAATVAATEAAMVQRIEIVGERRRVHDTSFRAEVLSEAMTAGAQMKQVARRYGICTSLIYRWRREASSLAKPGSTVQLVPVKIAEPRAAEKRAAPTATLATPQTRRGVIEIELNGGVRLRVDVDVSLAALRRVVAALQR